MSQPRPQEPGTQAGRAATRSGLQKPQPRCPGLGGRPGAGRASEARPPRLLQKPPSTWDSGGAPLIQDPEFSRASYDFT